MINPFAHLHVHSDHSVLDGAAQITGIVKAAVADNQPGVALTDHGSMSGAVDLLRAADKAGVTGIVGNEMYMAVGSRTERQTVISSADVDPDDPGTGRSKAKRYFHLTALAESTAGYRNLTALSSKAWIDGFWAKPRADHELLAAHGDGLILLTGCLGGEVANELLAGNFKAACEVVDRMRSAVGQDSVYVEVMDHGIPAQRRIIPDLYRLADELGVKTVVTNDSHYVAQADAHTHDALLAVQTGCLLHDHTRFRFNGDGHYVKTAAEMRAVSDDRWWRAGCDSTLEIVERVAAGGGNSIIPNTATLPRFPLPHPWSEMPYHEAVPKYLMHLTFTGAQHRYGNELPAAVKERLRFEFDTIVGMGFAAYFLIVHELISWCREQNIRVGPGRGSAAGCAISYCLGVVGVDPIGNDLLFERFLNPDRVSMPDIDMDFEDRHRDRVIDHLRDVYGNDAVAQLGTFGVIGARQATKDAARILARPNAWATELTTLMPALYMGRDTPLVKCLGLNGNEPHPGAGDLRDRYLTDDSVREALNLAVGFEGLIRAEGRHASAVVITDGPVMDHLPVRQTWKADGAGGYEQDGPITTMYDGATVEGLGFLKLDVLGLKNLTIMERCLDHVEAATGVRPDIDDLPDDFEDPTSVAAWKLLQAGEAVGVFQFESAPMRDILRRAKPTTRTELAALNALYRPGAMRYIDPFIARRHGREEISYDQWTRDPAAVAVLDQILGPTMGFPLFQEQSMQMAKELAGFTPGESDSLRKAIGKKSWDVMNKLEPKWVAGITDRFGDERFATRLWEAVKASADYSFNKSHSLCYGGYIAWQTVWLKANYPVEYMAAWLECAKGPERRAELYVECRAMGIGLLPPDVNLSESWPTPEDGKIRLGFAVIKSLAKVVGSIMAERDARGPFVSFADLCARVPDLSRAQLDVLVKSGACDRFGPRLGLMVVADVYKSAGKSGRADLLVDVPVPPVEMSSVDRLRFELAALSTTVTGSLVDHAARSLKAEGARPVSAVFAAAPHTSLKVGGVLSSASVQSSKKGNWFGRFTLEGAAGVVPVIVFQKTLEELAGVLQVPLSTKLGDLLVGLPVVVSGRVQIDEGEQVDDGVDEDGDEQREMIAYSVTPVGFDDVDGDRADPTGPAGPASPPAGSGEPPPTGPVPCATDVAAPTPAADPPPTHPDPEADMITTAPTAPTPAVTAEVAGDVTETAAHPPVTDIPTPVVVFFLNAMGAIPTLGVTSVMAHQFEQVAERFGAAKWVDPANGRVVVMVPWPGASERNVVQVAAAKLRELGVAGKIGEFVVHPAEHLYITSDAAAEVARTVLVAEPQAS